MVATVTERVFSFLASGPKFRLALPSDFEPVPGLSSPLLNEKGGRSFDFVPAYRDRGIGDGDRFLRTLTARDGRVVELYEQIEPPPVWDLRWALASGAVYTHLREEDGVGMADITVASLAIVEDQLTGAPFLLPDPPLRFVASAAPGYQETATYLSPARGEGWSVTLQRPGFVRVGKVMVAPSTDDGLVAIRVGLPFGLEARIWAGTDLASGRNIASTLLESLAEL